MRKIFILFALTLSLLFTNSLAAQKQLTLEDVISGGHNFYNYLPKRYKVEFRADKDELVYTRNDVMYSREVGKDNENMLIVLKDLSDKVDKVGGGKLNYWPKMNWISEDDVWFEAGGKYIRYNIVSTEIEVLAKTGDEGANADFCFDNKRVAYTKEHDLFMSSDNGEVLVAKAIEEGIIYGQTVHRSEFGISKGTFWSPQGNYLAFYRKDESMVADYPLVNVDTRIATVENIKYPMAGMTSEEVAVCIYNVQSGDTIHLKTASPVNRYFTNIAWSPDEKFLLVAELNRGQNHMQLNKYSVATGEMISTLFEEKDEQWVEPQNPALFVPGITDKFIWQSMRNGHNTLYLYDINGELIKQLTDSNLEVTGITGFDKKSKNLFFTAVSEDAMNSYGWVVSLTKGKARQITTTEGSHYIKVSKSGKNILDFYSSFNVPYKVNLIDASGEVKEELFTADNPYKGIDVGEIMLFKVKAADGKTDLNARMVLPTDFDSSKKYPVIVYVYGGPHAQLVKNCWLGGASGWQMYMAQKGCIALTLDNRGSQYRGEEFEQIIHRQLGKAEVADQMKGVDSLKGL